MQKEEKNFRSYYDEAEEESHDYFDINDCYDYEGNFEYYIQCEVEFDNVTPSDGKRSYFALQGSVDGKWEANKFNPWNKPIYDIKNGVLKISYKKTSNVKQLAGRYPGEGVFLLKPNTMIDVTRGKLTEKFAAVQFENKMYLIKVHEK